MRRKAKNKKFFKINLSKKKSRLVVVIPQWIQIFSEF